MDLKPIKTEADYRQGLAEIKRLFKVELNPPEGDRLEILTTLIEAYEEKHYPIEQPLPYEAILYHLESRHSFSTVSSFIFGLKCRGVSEELIQEVFNWLTDKNLKMKYRMERPLKRNPTPTLVYVGFHASTQPPPPRGQALQH